MREFDAHPHVGDIRGRGLFLALELVRRARDQGAVRAGAEAARGGQGRRRCARACWCYPMGGTIDGARGDHVLLAPPFIISEADLDQVIARLSRALDAGIAAAR